MLIEMMGPSQFRLPLPGKAGKHSVFFSKLSVLELGTAFSFDFVQVERVSVLLVLNCNGTVHRFAPPVSWSV
jgi:hypothetical protein